MKLLDLLSLCTLGHIIVNLSLHWYTLYEIGQFLSEICVLEHNELHEEKSNLKESWEATWIWVNPSCCQVQLICYILSIRCSIFNIEISRRNYIIFKMALKFVNPNDSFNLLFPGEKIRIINLNTDQLSECFEFIFRSWFVFQWRGLFNFIKRQGYGS